MSSLAQEESRSILENITWGHRKSFADGKVRIPYKRFLGYKKGVNSKPWIVAEEAEVVAELVINLVKENATSVYSQDDYLKKYIFSKSIWWTD